MPSLLVLLVSVTSSEMSFMHYDTERSPIKLAQVPRAISIIVSEIKAKKLNGVADSK